MNDAADLASARSSAAQGFPLEPASPGELGFHEPALARLRSLIAVAHRRGPLSGRADRARPARASRALRVVRQRRDRAGQVAGADTLWLLFSNTKVITAAGIWALVEDGALAFSDRVAEHIPEFARHGKGGYHARAGPEPPRGISEPDAVAAGVGRITSACAAKCATSRSNGRPARGSPITRSAAHWTAAALIEAVAGGDYRDFLRSRIMEPLGLARELYVGLAGREHGARRHHLRAGPRTAGSARWKSRTPRRIPPRGHPEQRRLRDGARMAAFYQMMVNGGELNGTRLFSRRLIEFVTRNHTGDMVDQTLRHADAPRAGRARARHHRDDTRPGHPRVPAHLSGTAASAPPTAGAIPIRACRSPTSPTARCPTRGTACGSTWWRISCIRRSTRIHVPYRVRAHNSSTASENRMHSDDVARRFGFQGGLVPGVTVFAYMTRPIVAHYGARWLERGWAEVSLTRPAYENDLLTVAAVTSGDGQRRDRTPPARTKRVSSSPACRRVCRPCPPAWIRGRAWRRRPRWRSVPKRRGI